MRGKIILVVGLATGYVLGARAGRERYEQIKAGADKVWNTPTVQAGVQTVQDFAGDRVDAVKANLSTKARNALASLIGREPLKGPQSSTAAAKAGSTRAATPAPKTAASSTGASKPAARTAAARTATKTPAKKPTGTTRSSAASASPASAESDD